MSPLRVGRGRLTVDLRHGGDDADRRLQSVIEATPRTVVILRVAPRQPVTLAIESVRQWGAHLEVVDVECADHTTRMVWLDALENGVHGWMAAL